MKTTFKTLKAPLLLAATFSALSINVLAETYTVQVELNSTIGETPLEIIQTQAMSYPLLEVNEATVNGANCLAISKDNTTGFDGQPATDKNSLCPNDVARRAEIRFKGAHNALITFERILSIQEKNGVRFAHWDGNPYTNVYNAQLSEDGWFNSALSSSIILVDKSQVTDSVMEFTYDISASYQ